MSSTSNRRAACDRCHRLKMRCVSDSPGSQQQCNRCRGAGTPCHYSVPGKPGRPQSQPSRAVPPEATTMLQAKPQSGYVSPRFRSHSIEQNPFDCSTLESIEAFPSLTLGPTDWAALGFVNDGQNDLEQSPSVWSGDFCTDYFPTVAPLKEPGLPTRRMSGVASLPAIESANFGDNTQYLQQLSEFYSRLCLQSKLEPSTATVDQIETAAAQILETSIFFLQLINGTGGYTSHSAANCYITPERTLNGDYNDDKADEQDEDEEMETGSDGSRPKFELPTAALLQLLVIYMRITELHCSLYTAIFDYLRRENTIANGSSAAFTTPTSTRSLQLHSGSISVVGITLTPPTKLQLQLVLQICTHYLGGIQTALHKVDGLGNTDTKATQNAQDSALGSVLVRMVMIQEQQKWTQKICGILTKIREEHGLLVQF